MHFLVRLLGENSVILEFHAGDFDRPIRFEDWNFPVPRIGERVWLKLLMDIATDDPCWRVWDVWWEPEAEDGEAACAVFVSRYEE